MGRPKRIYELSAENHIKGLKILDRMNEMLPMGRIKNTLEYSEEHPYWRGDKEARDRALGIIEAQLRLLEQIMPKRMPRVRKEKAA
jgi:hypothetical protein